MSAQANIEFRHIPENLKKLSLISFLCGIFSIALAVWFIGLDLSTGHLTGDLTQTATLALGIAAGFFLIGMSRGLRRGVRSWRIIGLFVAWVGFAVVVYKGYLMIAPHFQTHPYPRPPELTTGAMALLFCALLFQLWQFRVLTHPDVVDYFHRPPVA